MAKVSAAPGNDFCPQALFLYGTQREDGTPDFGLFCWFSYAWVQGEQGGAMGVIACIGEEKLTKDLIRKNGVFSANLVTESLLPLADYYGNTSGRETADKMKRLPTVGRGEVLNVPTIEESPLTFELKVLKEIHVGEGSDVFICEIRNVLLEESLKNQDVPFEDRLRQVAPAITAGENTYFSLNGRSLGHWGEPMRRLEGN